MTGNKPAELNAVPLPPGAELPWRWFCMMANKRQSGMGVSPLLDSEINAFFRKHHVTPEPWQLKAIDKLDLLALESVKEK